MELDMICVLGKVKQISFSVLLILWIMVFRFASVFFPVSLSGCSYSVGIAILNAVPRNFPPFFNLHNTLVCFFEKKHIFYK